MCVFKIPGARRAPLPGPGVGEGGGGVPLLPADDLRTSAWAGLAEPRLLQGEALFVVAT